MEQPQANRNRKAKLDPDELSILCEQIALIVRSGLPLHDGVEALCGNYRNTRYAERFEALDRVVSESGSLYLGVVAAGIFPKYMAEMTNIGEKTGELDSVMTGLSRYYQREAKIRRAVVSAVTYPLILIVILATLVGVLVIGVLPIFDGVFRSMGIDAAIDPWLSTGVNVGKSVLIAAAALIVLALFVLLLMRIDGKGHVRAMLMRLLPPIRRIADQISASRFAASMAMMLRSGYPLDDSLKLVGGVISDDEMASKVEACRAKMAEGLSFPDAVEQLRIFEPLHSRMIRVGFKAGQVDGVLRRLADLYDDEVDESITRIVSIIEPSLAALMAVIIGAILLSVMLPLLSLLGGMA